jgi:hypothetical protein
MQAGTARKKSPRVQRARRLDLRPYAGRWVALVNGRIAGIGLTAQEARIAAKLSRPKEEPVVRFVPKRQPQRIENQTDGKRARREVD